MAENEQVTVTINNLDGETIRQYPGEITRRDDQRRMLQVETHYDGEVQALGDAELNPGDRLVIRFFEDRMYSIVHIFDRDTVTLEGWFCNFMRPPSFEDGRIDAEDLALGLYVDPDEMRTVVVNRDQFETLDLPQRERDIVEDALARLMQAAAENAPPFGNEELTSPPADRSMPGPEENLAKDPKRNIDLNNPRTDRRSTTEN